MRCAISVLLHSWRFICISKRHPGTVSVVSCILWESAILTKYELLLQKINWTCDIKRIRIIKMLFKWNTWLKMLSFDFRLCTLKFKLAMWLFDSCWTKHYLHHFSIEKKMVELLSILNVSTTWQVMSYGWNLFLYIVHDVASRAAFETLEWYIGPLGHSL